MGQRGLNNRNHRTRGSPRGGMPHSLSSLWALFCPLSFLSMSECFTVLNTLAVTSYIRVTSFHFLMWNVCQTWGEHCGLFLFPAGRSCLMSWAEGGVLPVSLKRRTTQGAWLVPDETLCSVNRWLRIWLIPVGVRTPSQRDQNLSPRGRTQSK